METTSALNSNTASSLSWTITGIALAVLGVAGSLWLSLGMNLKACPLCLYQRTFMMSAAAVLLVGVLTEIRRSPMLPLVALPAIAAGLGVAGFHVYLEQTGKLECPLGVFGIGTAPQQSLALFLVLFIVLLASQSQGRTAGARPSLSIGAALLGFLMAAGTITSAPPMPPAPSEPYPQAPDVCRPPFHSVTGPREANDAYSLV